MTWRGHRVADLTGEGVRVAVLDSGIDGRHPFLQVDEAVSTCLEPSHIPGRHGTFCAGVIAAIHPHYWGIAPRASILDIKVARSDGLTTPEFLVRGIDEAMKRGAHVLSISLGLGRSSQGWVCPDGDCILCRAADDAVRCGAVIVAAAGNQHRERSGKGMQETELLCPGHARDALAVGAVEQVALFQALQSLPAGDPRRTGCRNLTSWRLESM